MIFNRSQGASERGAVAGLLWPSLLTLLGLAILIGLGTWQMGRKAEKDALIARLEARAQEVPVTLEEAVAAAQEGDVEYMRVKVRGILLHDKERYLYAPHQRYGAGYDVFAPLKVGEARYVWVNLGYVPERLLAPGSRTGGGLHEETEITGLARLSALPGMFTPPNDVAHNRWYWRDLDGMHASAFDPEQAELIPFFIEAEAGEDASRPEWPKPGASSPAIFNRHLEYALTWYGLALTLLGVYVAFVWHLLTRRGKTS